MPLPDQSSSFSSDGPTPTLAYAGTTTPSGKDRLILIGAVSLCIGVAGLLINTKLMRRFARTIVVARMDRIAADQAAAQEVAAEAAERASEAQARANPPRGLTPEEAEEFIKNTGISGAQFTGAQRGTLISAITARGQRFVDPSIPVTPWEPPDESGPLTESRIVLTLPREQLLSTETKNSQVSLQMIHRQSATEHPTFVQLILGSDGALVYQDVDSPAGHDIGNASGLTHDLSYVGLAPERLANQVRAHAALPAAWMAFIATGMAEMLSVLLLAAGILLLMKTLTGLAIRMLWIYALAKIPVAIFSAFAFAHAAFKPVSLENLTEKSHWAAFALLGCVYPILLIIPLRQYRSSTTGS